MPAECVWITPACHAALVAHALADSPRECCGLLIAPAQRPNLLSQAHPCGNLQDEAHRRFPAQYPRDARAAFLLDWRDFARVESLARRQGLLLVGIYHSHIGAEAFLSADDRRAALLTGATPLFPDFLYLILGVRHGRFQGARAFRFSVVVGDFQEVELAGQPAAHPLPGAAGHQRAMEIGPTPWGEEGATEPPDR